MTDRELLELAARSAGLDLEWCDFWGCMAKNLGVIDGFDRHTCWNPLQDDGDALRLAVKLGLFVYPLNDIRRTGVRIPCEGIGGKYDALEDHGKDPMAATRRAITRAAAQMQLNKENGNA